MSTVSDKLPVGKLPPDLLQSLLARYAGYDERLVVAAGELGIPIAPL